MNSGVLYYNLVPTVAQDVQVLILFYFQLSQLKIKYALSHLSSIISLNKIRGSLSQISALSSPFRRSLSLSLLLLFSLIGPKSCFEGLKRC